MNRQIRHKKKVKIVEKTRELRFWNCGKQYVCKITYPVSIPDYRIKEAFNKAFIGKKDKLVLNDTSLFSSLSNDISYTIGEV